MFECWLDELKLLEYLKDGRDCLWWDMSIQHCLSYSKTHARKCYFWQVCCVLSGRAVKELREFPPTHSCYIDLLDKNSAFSSEFGRKDFQTVLSRSSSTSFDACVYMWKQQCVAICHTVLCLTDDWIYMNLWCLATISIWPLVNRLRIFSFELQFTSLYMGNKGCC